MSDDEQQAAGGKAEDVEEEEEERPAQKRKPAAGKSKAPPAKKSKSEDDDAEGEGFSIGGMRRISVQQFRNKPLVSIREFYEKDGKLMPGKKGISLSVEQWQQVKAHVARVDAQIAALK
eukprot:gnl/Hemi2/18984_TR6279_c0_g10_i1.p1 gnl/Hemi2/18984_TR6279_c0_g10~~gnl/Hemi2/18984_TR6279_c0_g10_i1.p1  ORF type:complete len:129 (-),score=42.84 gnl/Hemi2/18984_TR6279_c0_g10_i1:87-443(-)